MHISFINFGKIRQCPYQSKVVFVVCFLSFINWYYLRYCGKVSELSHFCLTLTHSWRRSLSYRYQSIDLQSKSVDWFLYDRDLRHKRVKHDFRILQLFSYNFRFRIPLKDAHSYFFFFFDRFFTKYNKNQFLEITLNDSISPKNAKVFVKMQCLSN